MIGAPTVPPLEYDPTNLELCSVKWVGSRTVTTHVVLMAAVIPPVPTTPRMLTVVPVGNWMLPDVTISKSPALFTTEEIGTETGNGLLSAPRGTGFAPAA